MRGDIILKLTVNFLIPILLLYAVYSAIHYNTFGFFAIIQAIIIMIIAFSLYYIKYGGIRSSKILSFRFVMNVTIFAFLYYLCYSFYMIVVAMQIIKQLK